MTKRKWTEVTEDPDYRDGWVALTDCEYEEDVLVECVVVDHDADIAALQQKLEEQGIKNCTIKRVGEPDEGPSETPRISRANRGNSE